MRFGYVIRIGGDPEISAALREGVEMGTRGTTSPGLRPPSPKGEGSGSETARRLAMMRHTPEEWRQMTEDARVIYGGRRYRPRWVERLLVAWAMLCYGVSQAYRAQDKVLGIEAGAEDSGMRVRYGRLEIARTEGNERRGRLETGCGRSESAPTEGNERRGRLETGCGRSESAPTGGNERRGRLETGCGRSESAPTEGNERRERGRWPA